MIFGDYDDPLYFSYGAIKNKEEVNELEIVCDCLRSCKNILGDYRLVGKEIIPIVVYPSVQPLSLLEIRELYNVAPKPRIVTLSELEKLITQAK